MLGTWHNSWRSSGSSARRSVCSGPCGHWTTGRERRPGDPLGPQRRAVRVPGLRDAPARSGSDGLLLDHRRPRRRARDRLAVPGLVHGRRLRRPRAVPGVGRAPVLPAARAPAPSTSRTGGATPARRSSSPRCSSRVGYVLLRIQGSLPLNPQHFGAVGPALSFNTIVSFVTNTNWQNYGGETTMSYFSQIGVLTVPAVRERGRRHRRGDRDDAGLRSPELADDRQLLGRHHALHALRPAAHRVRRRHHHRRLGRRADPRRPGHHPQLAERRHPDHRARPRGLHGADHAARDQRRRVLQRRPASTPSRTRPGSRTSSTSCSLSPSRSRSPTRSARWWAASSTGAALLAAMVLIFGGVGGLHQLRGAPGQPRGRHRRGRRSSGGQHGGQGGALRRHVERPVQRVDDADLRRRGRTAPPTRTTRWAGSGRSPG